MGIEKIITCIAVFIPVFITVYTQQKKRYTDIYKNRLDLVYFPLFTKLEKYFYQYQTHQRDCLLCKALIDSYDLIIKQRQVAPCYLYMLFDCFANEKDFEKKNKLFNEISSDIIEKYSEMNYKIYGSGLSHRYKKLRKLYKSKKQLYLHGIWIYIQAIYVILMVTSLSIIITIFCIKLLNIFLFSIVSL